MFVMTLLTDYFDKIFELLGIRSRVRELKTRPTLVIVNVTHVDVTPNSKTVSIDCIERLTNLYFFLSFS